MTQLQLLTMASLQLNSTSSMLLRRSPKEMPLIDQARVRTASSLLVINLTSGDRCYIVNVGDSRSVLSAGGGLSAVALSEDHRPNEDSEQQRIIKGGGQIY
jgi:serine/threonine protein phosphatase PrpC